MGHFEKELLEKQGKLQRELQKLRVGGSLTSIHQYLIGMWKAYIQG